MTAGMDRILVGQRGPPKLVVKKKQKKGSGLGKRGSFGKKDVRNDNHEKHAPMVPKVLPKGRIVLEEDIGEKMTEWGWAGVKRKRKKKGLLIATSVQRDRSKRVL